MRDKLANVAAVCIPLAFIGGWSQGGIGMAIGSAFLWSIIFAVIRPK